MKLRWLPVIAITMLVCNVMLAYRTNFLRDRIVELERQVEVNPHYVRRVQALTLNAIHRLIVQEHAKCQCKEPSGK